MNQTTKIIIAAAAAGTVTLSIVLFNMLSMLPLFVRVLIIGAMCASVIFGAYCVMKAQEDTSRQHKKSIQKTTIANLDEIQKMRKLLKARIKAAKKSDSPFTDQLLEAGEQLDTLEHKQIAMSELLNNIEGSSFLTVSEDVNKYVLKNANRILNRVIIYGASNPDEEDIHKSSLQELLDDNAKVLTDFENLLVEISQISDDITAETPCLNELTQALRSVRSTGGDDDWQQPQQMQM